MAESKEPTLVDIMNKLITMEKKIDDASAISKHQTKKIKNLEETIRIQNLKIEILESETRKNNLIIFGIPEKEREDMWMLKEKIVSEVIGRIGVNITEQEIDFIKRIGMRTVKVNRPIKVGLTTRFKKIEILKKSSGLKDTKIAVREDLDKKTREIQKKLIPHKIEAKRRGMKALIIGDKLIINGEQWSAEEIEDQIDVEKAIEKNEGTKKRGRSTDEEGDKTPKGALPKKINWTQTTLTPHESESETTKKDERLNKNTNIFGKQISDAELLNETLRSITKTTRKRHDSKNQ